MRVQEIRSMCKSFPGAIELEQGDPSNILVYKVANKKFAYFKISEPEKWRFSFRVSPERFVELTDLDGVQPARYMHRFHWLTIVNVENFNFDYLKELVSGSYNKAFSSLKKYEQRAINTL